MSWIVSFFVCFFMLRLVDPVWLLRFKPPLKSNFWYFVRSDPDPVVSRSLDPIPHFVALSDSMEQKINIWSYSDPQRWWKPAFPLVNCSMWSAYSFNKMVSQYRLRTDKMFSSISVVFLRFWSPKDICFYLKESREGNKIAQIDQ